MQFKKMKVVANHLRMAHIDQTKLVMCTNWHGVVVLILLGAIVSNSFGAMAAERCDFEATYAPTQHPGYKTTGQQRLDFWFDLPSAWSACDHFSHEEYRYFLRNKGWPDNVDVYVWGSHWDYCPTDDQVVSVFEFRDGIQGYRFDYIYEGIPVVRYIRIEGRRSIGLFVTGPEDWIKSHEIVLNTIAASLRPGVDGRDWRGVPTPCDKQK